MDSNERTMIGGGQAAQDLLKLPPTLRISLAFTKGPLTGQSVRLTKTTVSVGRKEPADIVILDQTVSGSHARFEINSMGTVTLHDCNSTNGTFVCGQKIIEPQSVQNMDEVGFGDTRALLTVVNDPYGLYGDDDFVSPDTTPVSKCAEQTSTPFSVCLLGGFRPEQKQELEKSVLGKRLAAECIYAAHGGEFVELASSRFIQKKPVDLIVTEIKMPYLNGIQALIAFRHIEKSYGVENLAPAVLFTEMPQDQNIDKAVQYIKFAKYFQTDPDPAEFQRRSDALADGLKNIGYRKKA